MAVSTATPKDDGLPEAAEREARYEWMAAAEAYLHAIDRLPQKSDYAESARLTERLAECYFKGALQSEKREEFKRRMMLAKTSFGKAVSQLSSSPQEPISLRLKAREHFVDFWTRDTATERSDLCEMCIALAEEAVQRLDKQEEQGILALIRKNLLTYIFELHFFNRDPARLRRLFDEAMEAGEKATSRFEASGDDVSLVESLHLMVWFLTDLANFVLEPAKFKDAEGQARVLTKRLVGLAERMGTPYELSLSREAAGWVALELDGNVNEALKCFRLAISSAEPTRDSYLTGRLYEEMAYASTWAVKSSEDDPRWRRETLEQGVGFGQLARSMLRVPLHGGFLSAAAAFTGECHSYLASFIETEQRKKKDHLQKAIESAREGWAYERDGWSWALPSHALSRALYQLAALEPGKMEKAKLLGEALPIRESMARTYELLTPNSWDVGVVNEHLALLKAELSKIEEDPEGRTKLLQGAMSDMQKAIDQCTRWASTPTLKRDLGIFHERFADILLQLHSLTSEPHNGRTACKSYETAIGLLADTKNLSSIPPVRWKLAKAQDSLGELQAASESFQKASEEYRRAGKGISSLEDLFRELGSYMEAWSGIELARLYHDREEYSVASQKYSEVAQILKPTKSWTHLTKHYNAYSELEKGEAYSHQEQVDSSVEAFTTSVELFREAREDIEKKLGQGPEGVEADGLGELKDWLQATEEGYRYSLGRIRLEEAKLLDRKGEKAASASKYRSASEAFGSLLAGPANQRDQAELQTLVHFSNALAKMKDAEAKASPELYQEAAELFGRAEKTAQKEKFRLLSLAHSSISRALASGTHFRRTRNSQVYAAIKNELEAAGDYYEEAGFKNAAKWTRATQRLFDALAYLAAAEAELDSKRKAEFYHLAEKHLEVAGGLYEEAGFSAKQEEVMRHLKRAREERNILLTPMEALAENPTSSGQSFAPITLNRDQPLGLERFENASIVGHLRVAEKGLGIGSGVTLEFEFVNVGRAPATLVKLENIAPEGFELDKSIFSHQAEDGFLDMRGKRLEYLKTHEVKVPIRAKRKGAYELRPRVLYVDEKGVYRSHQFEAARIVVTDVAGRSLLESERRLSAIMFTDLVGYTSLTEENERLALELLEEHRKLLRPLFPKYKGEEIKTVGDMFLVEFASALEAVRCAIQIREVLSSRNREHSEAKKIHLRIGIHVGDVEHSQGDVYGDAVNIASRIEPLAQPGGIVVTRQVYDQVRNHSDIKMESLGSRELKNVKESFELFRVSP